MLNYQTINSQLKEILLILMKSYEFKSFRLVGGTALSLQIGHRISVDIDLFSDEPYGTIDFKAIDSFIEETFPYHHHFSNFKPALGKSYSIGINSSEAIKLDVYYTDSYIQAPVIESGIRMASVEEIIAMKIDVIQRGGRKKDYWDLHEFLTKYTLDKFLFLHESRYPYNHDKDLIISNFLNFDLANNDMDPICLKGKYWEFIKEDFIDFISLK